MDADLLLIISRAWPIFVAFILLIVTLAQAHYRIKVLEEKVKVAFELSESIQDSITKVMNIVSGNVDNINLLAGRIAKLEKRLEMYEQRKN